MVAFDQFVKGAGAFIESEIISVLPGWQKWVAGGIVAMAMDRSASVFKAVKDIPAVRALGVVREDGMIDIENLYKYIRSSAEKTGPVTIEVPMVGPFKASVQDLDRLYQMIVGG